MRRLVLVLALFALTAPPLAAQKLRDQLSGLFIFGPPNCTASPLGGPYA